MTCSCSGAMTQSGMFLRILQASDVFTIYQLQTFTHIYHLWKCIIYFLSINFLPKNSHYTPLVFLILIP